MNALPIKKAIFERAKELGIKEILLHFSGGNDEGMLYVDTKPNYDANFNRIIEDWAWDAYSYSGAGDGTDYGDDICYDLENGKVTTTEWCMRREQTDWDAEDLEIDDETNKSDENDD
jgi:hypothetical protein